MHIADTSGQDTLLSPTKSAKRPLLIISGAGLLLLSLFYIIPALTQWGSSQSSVPFSRLRVGEVTQGNLVRDLSVQGRVVAAVSPKLYSPAQGTITFSVDAGDDVMLGQELARIESPALTSELEQEQAVLSELSTAIERQKIQAKKQMLEDQKAIDMAAVALTAADREKRRADTAYTTNAISTIDYEKAQDELHNARLVHQHAVKDAQLNVESLAFEIQSKTHQLNRQTLKVADLQRKTDQLILLSPVNGIVGNLAVQQKNQVTQHQAILSVVDLSEFELEVDIPESYADDLAIGMISEVEFNGRLYPAKLVTISPEIQDNQVAGRIRFVTEDAQGEPVIPPTGLRQNQRLTTRILMENKENVLMVQRGQFLESGSGRIAYKIEDNVAYRVPITTGARSLAAVEIVSGLAIHDRIIVSGTDQFNGADTVLITQ
ncbi:HlyD family efflux transporter periplasmic adaptor subunit [Alteromonas pelagimontana]|uniref:HlyD family efflux transporter periplasmic adaptor subunit n=1 Tax=Alteromonas pelagimontana TaxID=1858656 RepID=A0A6M4MHK3_9ALTE|nr:efflux RND transporter periplasmic adaptor subunit [Alteromonas pelagimontana]QJR82589.1 HlyD family efflux transporter periplasmic adaptor subunit [Alteromonas pelagimontana]